MKKILTALIVAALLITAMALTSCLEEEEQGHVHSFNDFTVKPTCMTEGYDEHTCVDCGYSYQDNIVETDPDNHGYGEKFVYQEATCSETGIERQICVECGHVFDKKISKLKCNTECVVLVEPTCTEKGTAQYTCVDCGAVTEGELKANGHSYGEWIVDVEPSCESEEYGLQHKVCSECGDIVEEDIPSHNPDAEQTVVTAPTCTTIGYTTYVCADCGKTYVRDYKGTTAHKFGSYYYVEGYDNLQRRDCEICGHYEVK